MERADPYRASSAPPSAGSCLMCGKPGTAGTDCPACAVRIPSPGDERPVHAARCLRCDAPMLAIAPTQASVLHVCSRCHGMFVPPRAWNELLARPELAFDVEAKLPPRPPADGALYPLVRCPACAREMDRLTFAALSGIVIDTCVDRHGSWLDAGELGAVLRFAQSGGRDAAMQRGRGAGVGGRIGVVARGTGAPGSEVAALRERLAGIAAARAEVDLELSHRAAKLATPPRRTPLIGLAVLTAILLSGGAWRCSVSRAVGPDVPTPSAAIASAASAAATAAGELR